MRAKVAQYASENKLADDAAKALVEKYDEEKRRRESAENVLRELMDCDSELHATYQSAKAHFARFGGGNG